MLMISELIRNKLYMSGYIEADPAKRPAIMQDINVVVNLDHVPDPTLHIDTTTLHWPIDDGKVPDEGILNAVVDFVVANVKADRCVLVHCYMGWNRAGLVSALALRKLLQVSGKEAVEFVRVLRSASALSNRSFANYVESLDAP